MCSVLEKESSVERQDWLAEQFEENRGHLRGGADPERGGGDGRVGDAEDPRRE
ncbi:hypothetical protein [Edaphobacter modestus]|uniref:Uncharacterized protein n=1 Tax=Edaphobacter modestus TaxID=388466 RepID=A0A4Q7YUI2_9BACT|nr:hypothetical protein [Edaphobacter modestus]RZU41522.1 hypothetical protein BDD14_3045 [Edaphobacter modestus]